MTPILQRTPGLTPHETGPIHFVGIGGIGMSGIAEVLHSLGFTVQGSDQNNSPNLQRLKKLGIQTFHGHNKNNLQNAEVVVFSSAVSNNNPELIHAKQQFIPTVHRSEMLAELMRLKHSIAIAGTHGKTTTTSLISHSLWKTQLNPTTINGGIVNDWGSNAKLGNSNWMVVEADESDGSFNNLRATIAVVTNCDTEHMDFWKTKENLHNAFKDFIHGVPFYGFSVLCLDHPVISKMAKETEDRRVITYGLSSHAEVHAQNIQMDNLGMKFNLVIAPRGSNTQQQIQSVFLPLMGKHNVQNTLAAIAVAHGLGLNIQQVANSFSDFSGVKRRFTRIARINNINFIDDYAHHPVEIKAVLETAKQSLARQTKTKGRVIAVIQPHRFSRLHDMLEDFSTAFDEAAAVFVTPVYAAGEKPREGVNHHTLVNKLKRHGHRRAKAVSDINELSQQLATELSPEDCVVFLGAGDITKWAEDIPNILAQRWNIAAA
ncbi:MAG: UDP-N-acetylmuramate--L-alanine ligase [Alphaproteobacteria bacterium]